MKLKEVRKNIALSLLGIFLFPVVFQNLHVIRHHMHESECCHHIDVSEKKLKNSKELIIRSSENESVCPIVQYKLSINMLPEVLPLDNTFLVFVEKAAESTIEWAFQPFYSAKSPRAPPFQYYA